MLLNHCALHLYVDEIPQSFRKPALPCSPCGRGLGKRRGGEWPVPSSESPLSLGPREALPRSVVSHSSFPPHRSPRSITQDRGSPFPLHLSCLSLSLLPLPPSTEKKCSCTSLCKRYDPRCQEDMLPVVQSGLSCNSFIKSTTIHKALRRGQTQRASGSCTSLYSLCICATVAASFQASLTAPPPPPQLQQSPESRLAPLIQPTDCQRDLINMQS